MEQMNQSLGSMLPEAFQWAAEPLVAIITLAIGIFIAIVARAVISGAINRTGLGRRAQTTGGNIGKSIGKAAYWIIILMALVLALGQFEQLKGPMAPLTDMMSGIGNYGGKIIGAVILLVVGAVVARVGKEAVQSSLEAAQVDALATRIGLREEGSTTSIPKSLGGLVFAFILIMFGIAAIDALGIEVISGPIQGMLQTVLDYIPSMFGAAIVLALAVWIGRFASNVAQNTLPALGVDSSINTFTSLDGERSAGFVPSKLIANIIFIGIVLMGLTAAMRILNIDVLTNVFNTILEVGGRVALGAVIIGAGLFIANFVSKLVAQAGGELAGTIIKYATIVLFTFMGLETMQLGEGIVDTAFRYSVMAAAVAAGLGGAIAFGWGGRDWAGKKLEEWMPSKKTPGRRTPKS